MLQVVVLIGGRYGLQNTWTGVVLTKNNGDVRTFRTKWGARRKARHLTSSLNKTINSFEKRNVS